ncbi:Ground-like domain-containing protein [Strongyloides ratti]|uniref:Ground-like domain-containing protein n=1 Tax=Strongyloides ratti TaxID=34506 RepID=A0A090KYM4_STRRB|nr:Ground-like domain-containing protein [Strongyloides ratti]CEF62615.1 Ground-like domain-containing protein [Strongyloides ratti]
MQKNCDYNGYNNYQGYHVTQTFRNQNNYQNNYQNTYSQSKEMINNPKFNYGYGYVTQVNNQNVNLYQTTKTTNPTYQTDYNIQVHETQHPQYNLGSKHLSEDGSLPKSIEHSTISPEIDDDLQDMHHLSNENFTLVIDEKVVSPDQSTSIAPTYIRSTEAVYRPNFNFPLQYATTSTNTNIVKIDIKKQTKNKNMSLEKKNEEIVGEEYENNSSYKLQPKTSQIYKPIVQPLNHSDKFVQKEDDKNIDVPLEAGETKIAGLNFFNDPVNKSISNDIYDEVVPFNENIDQVEVVPSSISTSEANNNLPDIENALEYDDNNHISKRVKAKASKQYIKDDPIVNEITNNDLVKIPLKSTYERCNDKDLQRIMKTNMLRSPVISKQIIFNAWKNEHNENLDVICSKIPFSYTVVSSSVYCEIQTSSISCFAYIRPTNKKH